MCASSLDCHNEFYPNAGKELSENSIFIHYIHLPTSKDCICCRNKAFSDSFFRHLEKDNQTVQKNFSDNLFTQILWHQHLSAEKSPLYVSDKSLIPLIFLIRNIFVFFFFLFQVSITTHSSSTSASVPFTEHTASIIINGSFNVISHVFPTNSGRISWNEHSGSSFVPWFFFIS